MDTNSRLWNRSSNLVEYEMVSIKYRKISNIRPGLIFDFALIFGLIFEGPYIWGGLY